MRDNMQDEFWDSMEDIRAGMLASDTARAVPMSHYVDEDRKTLWFITAKGTDLAKSAQSGAKAEYIVSSKDEGFYGRIDGTLTAVENREKLDELWNAIASAWFEGGKQDPDVQLLRMDLSQAEAWATGGSLSFLYEIAKSHLTDSKPDMGQHGTIRF